MNYLLIGREGFHSDSQIKTSRVFSSDIELTEKELIQRWHKNAVIDFIGSNAEPHWTDEDFEETYAEYDGWNWVDMIFKSKKPIELEEVFNDFEE